MFGRIAVQQRTLVASTRPAKLWVPKNWRGACGSVTDERVAASREQRRGYAEHVNEPQVISINGTLASEAVTTALMLIAGDTRLAPYRRYAYPPGTLTVVTRPRQPNCPACQAARLITN